jgi:hypothetical protein
MFIFFFFFWGGGHGMGAMRGLRRHNTQQVVQKLASASARASTVQVMGEANG